MIIVPSMRPRLAAAAVSGVTWNPADNGADSALSNGNLTATALGSGAFTDVRATVGHATTGKYYFEVKIDAIISNCPAIGIELNSISLNRTTFYYVTGSWGIVKNSQVMGNGASINSYITLAVNDVIGIAVDFATGKFWVAQNNVWIRSGNPSAGTNASFSNVTGTMYPVILNQFSGTGSAGTARFASAQWTYTPPTGFGEW